MLISLSLLRNKILEAWQENNSENEESSLEDNEIKNNQVNENEHPETKEVLNDS